MKREVSLIGSLTAETVRADYELLQQALIREFSDPELEQGLIGAMDLKQGRQETPQAYYIRLRRTYFRARNEPGMEEDFNFRTLFLRNLHPAVSHLLGVLICPRSMSTQQLRDLVLKAYVKQKAASDKMVKYPTIYPVSDRHSELTIGGAQHAPQHKSKLSSEQDNAVTSESAEVLGILKEFLQLGQGDEGDSSDFL